MTWYMYNACVSYTFIMFKSIVTMYEYIYIYIHRTYNSSIACTYTWNALLYSVRCYYIYIYVISSYGSAELCRYLHDSYTHRDIHTYIYIYTYVYYIYIHIYKISANTPTEPFIIKLVYMNIITYVLNGYTLDRAYVYIEMYLYIYIFISS